MGRRNQQNVKAEREAKEKCAEIAKKAEEERRRKSEKQLKAAEIKLVQEQARNKQAGQ